MQNVRGFGFPHYAKPERRSHGSLSHIQCCNRQGAGMRGDVESGRQMPETRAAQISGIWNRRQLPCRGPVGEDPIECREDVLPEVNVLARERRPQLGFKQVG